MAEGPGPAAHTGGPAVPGTTGFRVTETGKPNARTMRGGGSLSPTTSGGGGNRPPTSSNVESKMTRRRK